MELNGMRADQVIQVRGYADQKPRNPSDPEDPSNRRRPEFDNCEGFASVSRHLALHKDKTRQKSDEVLQF